MSRKRNEERWERILGIHTAGEDESCQDRFHSPYQPTPYSVLERLRDAGFIRRNDLLIDYGCGMGRVSLFMARETQCRSIGVEYNERILERAADNAAGNDRVRFVCMPAEQYSVPPDANRFYFFNPFSAELLRAVLRRITESLYEHPRECLLIFYYPVEEYRHVLNELPDCVADIDCGDLFDEHDERERILIYRIAAE